MTIERPMFPPERPSRRSFVAGLAMAVPVAAAAPAALATALPTPAVAAVPVPTGINPLLIDLQADIGENLEIWRERKVDVDMRERAVKAWEKRNLLPMFLLEGDEGYHPTYRSDWYARRNAVMQKADLGKRKPKLRDAAVDCNDAVLEFAAVRAASATDLVFKIQIAIRADNETGAIARSASFDTLRLGYPRFDEVAA